MRFTILAALVITAMSGVMVCNANLDRFQTIIDRKPFGSDAPPQRPGTPGAGDQTIEQAFIKEWKISAFVRDKDTGRMQVGLVNSKMNSSYLMDIGRREDGVTLVEADFEREKVVLSKDGLAFWLHMDGTSSPYSAASKDIGVTPMDGTSSPYSAASKDNGVTPEDAPSVSEPVRRATRPTTFPPAAIKPVMNTMSGVLRSTSGKKALYRHSLTIPKTTAEGRIMTYQERRQFKMNMLKQLREKKPIADTFLSNAVDIAYASPAGGTSVSATATSADEQPDADLEQALQEYQMQAIREGRKTLPIPLSPESDAQMVREGYLSPIE